MLRIEDLPGNLSAAVCASAPVLSADVAERVDAIWRAELQERGDSLLDGQLFSIGEIKDGVILGWLSEYRLFLAQQREPCLFPALRVRPLAVTGYVVCDDGVIIGKRAENVTQDPGSWELLPSGGVDASMVDDTSSSASRPWAMSC